MVQINGYPNRKSMSKDILEEWGFDPEKEKHPSGDYWLEWLHREFVKKLWNKFCREKEVENAQEE